MVEMVGEVMVEMVGEVVDKMVREVMVHLIRHCHHYHSLPYLLTHPHPLLAAGVPATPQKSPAVTSND